MTGCRAITKQVFAGKAHFAFQAYRYTWPACYRIRRLLGGGGERPRPGHNGFVRISEPRVRVGVSRGIWKNSFGGPLVWRGRGGSAVDGSHCFQSKNPQLTYHTIAENTDEYSYR